MDGDRSVSKVDDNVSVLQNRTLNVVLMFQQSRRSKDHPVTKAQQDEREQLRLLLEQGFRRRKDHPTFGERVRKLEATIASTRTLLELSERLERDLREMVNTVEMHRQTTCVAPQVYRAVRGVMV